MMKTLFLVLTLSLFISGWARVAMAKPSPGTSVSPGPTDVGSASGSIAVTSRLNCFPEFVAVKSNQIGAKSVRTKSEESVKINFQKTDKFDSLFQESVGHGSSVLKVSASGPVLQSLISTQFNTDIDCNQNNVSITAHLYQYGIKNTAYWWLESNYKGSLDEKVFWQPTVEFDLVTHEPNVPLEVRWIIHNQAKPAAEPIVSKTIVTGGQRQMSTAPVEKTKSTPQEQCGCWDGKNKVCLPQADCL